MKRVDLAYGRTGLSADVADAADVIEPRYLPGLEDEAAAIVGALRSPTAGAPLRSVVPRGARGGISVCGATRPFPGRRGLPLPLGELGAPGAGATPPFLATRT